MLRTRSLHAPLVLTTAGWGDGVVPALQPTPGSACAVSAEDCPFPIGDRCTCTAGRWSCVADPPLQQPRYVGSPADPATLAKPIDTLSNLEVSQWCHWFVTLGALKGPYASEDKNTSAGYVDNLGGSAWSIFFVNACEPEPTQLARTFCEANLKVQPCHATREELTDCILTIDRGRPAIHGCDRFFENPDCDGTIVRRLGPEGRDVDPEGPMGCFSLRIR